MNEEYEHWTAIFKQKSFKERLIQLKNLLKNKKVVLYCNGIFFNALADSVKLEDYFDITGISDIRYETTHSKKYKNFVCIKPSELKSKNIDIILITTPNPVSIKKFLKENNLTGNETNIIELVNSDILFCSQDIVKTKQNYQKVLKKLQNKYKSGEKIRALFVCEENQKWGYQFVYEQMKHDPCFEVMPVLLFPVVTQSRIDFTQKENSEFFKAQRIEALDGYDYEKEKNKEIASLQPDLVFYQQPWYIHGKNHPKSVSDYALTMMIPYGYTTLNPNRWGTDSVKDVYSSLWTFFSESPYHNKFYQQTTGLKDGENLVATGSPKMDYYRQPANKKVEKLWKSSGKRIIWAPHHSILSQGLGMSNFPEQYKFFLEFAKLHQEYSFVLKPHPALRAMCISTGFMKEEEFDTYINEWQNLKNAVVYTQGNYFDIFKTSDVLITDCSSFLAEYFPSEKPIIFLDREGRAAFDEFGENIKQGFYRIDNTENLETLLEKLLQQENDPLKSVRKEILKNIFYRTQTSASSNIITFLKKKLITDNFTE